MNFWFKCFLLVSLTLIFFYVFAFIINGGYDSYLEKKRIDECFVNISKNLCLEMNQTYYGIDTYLTGVPNFNCQDITNPRIDKQGHINTYYFLDEEVKRCEG